MTMAVGNLVLDVWHIAAIVLGLLLSVLATGHVVLNKSDSRAAIAWVGFVWFVPLVGAVLYFIFGVNRIRHKAALLRKNLERYRAQAAHRAGQPPARLNPLRCRGGSAQTGNHRHKMRLHLAEFSPFMPVIEGSGPVRAS